MAAAAAAVSAAIDNDDTDNENENEEEPETAGAAEYREEIKLVPVKDLKTGYVDKMYFTEGAGVMMFGRASFVKVMTDGAKVGEDREHQYLKFTLTFFGPFQERAAAVLATPESATPSQLRGATDAKFAEITDVGLIRGDPGIAPKQREAIRRIAEIHDKLYRRVFDDLDRIDDRQKKQVLDFVRRPNFNAKNRGKSAASAYEPWARKTKPTSEEYAAAYAFWLEQNVKPPFYDGEKNPDGTWTRSDLGCQARVRARMWKPGNPNWKKRGADGEAKAKADSEGAFTPQFIMVKQHELRTDSNPVEVIERKYGEGDPFPVEDNDIVYFDAAPLIERSKDSGRWTMPWYIRNGINIFRKGSRVQQRAPSTWQSPLDQLAVEVPSPSPARFGDRDLTDADLAGTRFVDDPNDEYVDVVPDWA